MEAFSLPFDVGLTYPWPKEMHGDLGRINGGVTYFNNKNIEAVRSYFSAYLAKYLTIKDLVDVRFPREPRLAEWGGDEITHLRLLPPSAFEDHKQQDAVAQVALGAMYVDGIGVKQDYGEAYKWLYLVVTGEDITIANRAMDVYGLIEKLVTKDQIAAAEAFADDWQPKN